MFVSELLCCQICAMSSYRESHERSAAKWLTCPRKAGDLRPSQVHSLETVRIRCANRDFSLKFIGVPHHRNGLVQLLLRGRRSESLKCFPGLFMSVLPDKPPR
jgi:hypothetical protein